MQPRKEKFMSVVMKGIYWSLKLNVLTEACYLLALYLSIVAVIVDPSFYIIDLSISVTNDPLASIIDKLTNRDQCV